MLASVSSHSSQNALLPLAEAPSCETLPDPENGQVEQTGTALGSTATYTCFPGYQLKGVSDRTCAETGWSGKEPTCERKCGAPKAL